ncbi:MAG: hypothetical protein ACFFD1_15050, partial [Candidatus Thorarchaeota archaeon]
SKHLEDLILLGLVKKIGPIPRYYCLEPFLDSIVNSVDTYTNDMLIKMVENRIEQSTLNLLDKQEMYVDYIKKSLEEKRKSFINEMNNFSDSDRNKILEFLNQMVEDVASTSFSLIKDTEKKGKKVMNEIVNKEIQPILQLIEDLQSQLKMIYDACRSLELTNFDIPSDILFGEEAVLSMMKDLILRTKSNLMILMPIPEIQSIILISELILSKRIKVIITGDFEKAPKTILNRLNSQSSQGSVQLKQSNEIDSWAIIKDNEEILFAPHVQGDDFMVGIWLQSSIPGLEQLIQMFSMQIRSMSSKAQNIHFN